MNALAQLAQYYGVEDELAASVEKSIEGKERELGIPQNGTTPHLLDSMAY